MRSAVCAAAVAVAAILSPSAAAVTPVFVTDGGTTGGIVSWSPAGPGPDLGELSLLGSAANPFPTSGFTPYAFALHPSGRFAYASSRSEDELRTFQVALDGELSNEVVVEAGRAAGVAVTPDGRNVYLAGTAGNVLGFTIDPDTGAVAAHEPVAVGAGLDGIAVDPNGAAVFVSSPSGEKIYKLAVGPGGVLTPDGEEALPDGVRPRFLATNPVSGRPVLYAVVDDDEGCTEPGNVVSYDIATFGAGGAATCDPAGSSSPVSSDPHGIAVAPDGEHVYLANIPNGQIAKFDVNADGTLSGGSAEPARTSFPGAPFGLVVSPAGDSLYATGRDSSQISQYTIESDGELSPKSPATVSTTAPFANPTLLAARPDQPPVARFSVIYPGGATHGVAGEPVTFDASASTDPEGTPIVRYDWDFGDGTTASVTDPVTTHTYTAPGDFEVTLRVTDATGGSAELVYTGQSALRTGGAPGTGVAHIAAPVIPPALVQGVTPGPQPIWLKSFNIEPTQGTVLVKVPGSTDFVPVQQLTSVPVGSVVDVVAGEVKMTAQNGQNGDQQQGWFWGGVFQANQFTSSVVVTSGRRKRQRRRPRTITQLRLTGGTFRDCPPQESRRRGRRSSDGDAAGRRKRRRSKVRRLWGNAQGNFRSRGRHSSATVRGTMWLVEDRCDGTLTRVRRGIVEVRDLKRRRSTILRSGQKVLVKPR